MWTYKISWKVNFILSMMLFMFLAEYGNIKFNNFLHLTINEVKRKYLQNLHLEILYPFFKLRQKQLHMKFKFYFVWFTGKYFEMNRHSAKQSKSVIQIALLLLQQQLKIDMHFFFIRHTKSDMQNLFSKRIPKRNQEVWVNYILNVHIFCRAIFGH